MTLLLTHDRTPAARRRLLPVALLTLVLAAACDDAAGPIPGANPLADMTLHVPNPSDASRQAEEWRESRPEDAAAMDRIAREPRGVWLSDANPAPVVQATVIAAAAEGAVPVFVAYFIPRRDCSDAGAPSGDAYRGWVREVASALSGPSILVLEPDALAMAECVSAPAERFDLLAYAARTFTDAGAHVYIDAGHPRWLSPQTAIQRLRMAGIGSARGFALNVANFVGTAENVEYGQTIAAELGGVGFVIDTSRNGAGPATGNDWCNPPGMKLGEPPTTDPPHAWVDALLWVKQPGESDGLCNGGPPAGEWWPEYALELAR